MNCGPNSTHISKSGLPVNFHIHYDIDFLNNTNKNTNTMKIFNCCPSRGREFNIQGAGAFPELLKKSPPQKKRFFL